MILNSHNIEELVLLDSSLLNKLSHFNSLIKQWKIGQMIPALRVEGQKAKIKLLNSLTPNDLEIIKTHLKIDNLTLTPLSYESVKHFQVDINKANDFLKSDLFLNDFCITRDDNQLYISTWR